MAIVLLFLGLINLLFILGIMVMSTLAGMFGYSCEFLDELEGWMCMVGLLFFPILMLAGIKKAW